MKLPEQVVRLGTVIAVNLARPAAPLRDPAGVVLLREASPGHEGRARDGEAAAYAGATSCRRCHEEQFTAKYGGAHRNIGCENCHGRPPRMPPTGRRRSPRSHASASSASGATPTSRRVPTASRRWIRRSTSRRSAACHATTRTTRCLRRRRRTAGLPRPDRAHQGTFGHARRLVPSATRSASST